MFNIMRGFVVRIKRINRKYRKPKVFMTPMVRVALILLRFYLIFLVLLLIYRFITMI